MSRLTKKNSDNTYDVLLEKQIEANFKLGKLEDIFELTEEMYKKPVYWKDYNGDIWSDYYTESNILYNLKTNEIEIYEYEFTASYKVEEYGLTWAFTEEELKNKEE